MADCMQFLSENRLNDVKFLDGSIFKNQILVFHNKHPYEWLQIFHSRRQVVHRAGESITRALVEASYDHM